MPEVAATLSEAWGEKTVEFREQDAAQFISA